MRHYLFSAVLTLAVSLGLVGAAPQQADAAVISSTMTYSELNCNWQGYTAGKYRDGVNLTWATGSGSTRKYIRAQRLANVLKNNVKASLYGLTECDTQMLADLAKLMGSNWRWIGGENDAHNRTGWLYDSSKWRPGSLSVTVLPGDPDGGYTGRRLLQIGFYRLLSGTDPMLSVAMVHLSSGNPEARDLQMDAALDKIGGAVRLLAGDLNASSVPPIDETDPCRLTGPRWQMKCRGWTDPMARFSTFQDYGELTPGLPIDIISVSPGAQALMRITINSASSVDMAATYAADHNALKASVTFNQ